MSQTKAQILQGKGTANTVEGLTASGIVTASAFDVGTTIQIGNAGVITATSLDVRTLGGDINVGGAVTITGNLRVDGTQTIVNTETLMSLISELVLVQQLTHLIQQQMVGV